MGRVSKRRWTQASDDPLAREQALAREEPTTQAALATARQVKAQAVTMGAPGRPTLRRGGAKERRISLEDAQMRQGRKSRSQRVDGYKRHGLHDLETGLVRAVGVTPAHAPEAGVTETLMEDLLTHQTHLSERHMDRADLRSRLVRERPAELAIFCKAWPVRDGRRFPQTAFTLDWTQQVLPGPQGGRWPSSQAHWSASRRNLCRLPDTGALYDECARAQCQHPSR